MPFIVWNDRLSVGVGILDADHKKMVGILNELYDSILAGDGKSSLGGLLDRLVEYTGEHFAHEEGFFTQTQYTNAVIHKREHDEMAAWVKSIREQYNNNTLKAPTLEVMSYLKDWLFDHIIESDQKYRQHLNANGIS